MPIGESESEVTVIMLSWERRPNIPRIVSKLRQSEVPLDIWIWNNNPVHRVEARGILKACTVINSTRNFLCPARHALALLCRTKYVMFIDDDILPDKSLVKRLLAFARDAQFSVCGVAGVRLNAEEPFANPIHKCHSELYHITQAIPVDYVKGRVMFVETSGIEALWGKRTLLTLEELEEDDIALNFSVQMMTGFPSYVLPGKLFENLSGWDGGLHSDWERFCARRTNTIKAFKRLGWGSLVPSEVPMTAKSNFADLERKR